MADEYTKHDQEDFECTSLERMSKPDESTIWRNSPLTGATRQQQPRLAGLAYDYQEVDRRQHVLEYSVD